MPSSFLASASSSASSHLSYLIPSSAPPPLLMGQGYSVDGLDVDAASAAAAAGAVEPPRHHHQGARNAAGGGGAGHPPPRQCPRCQSGNTKFCYYNNYSRAQPRYLCKACRRHWTEGGTLRDVPVGGGRKNRRSKAAAAAAKASASAAAAAATAQAQGGSVAGGGGGGGDTFPDLLRQLVQFQPAAGGGGYAIDLGAWQQMAAATAPAQGGGDASALGGGDCGALQYWSGWQQDDMPGLDGAC
ncbi:unnamed protein product [Urochloa humidicola]